jgi:hypothetical protein
MFCAGLYTLPNAFFNGFAKFPVVEKGDMCSQARPPYLQTFCARSGTTLAGVPDGYLRLTRGNRFNYFRPKLFTVSPVSTVGNPLDPELLLTAKKKLPPYLDALGTIRFGGWVDMRSSNYPQFFNFINT